MKTQTPFIFPSPAVSLTELLSIRSAAASLFGQSHVVLTECWSLRNTDRRCHLARTSWKGGSFKLKQTFIFTAVSLIKGHKFVEMKPHLYSHCGKKQQSASQELIRVDKLSIYKCFLPYVDVFGDEIVDLWLVLKMYFPSCSTNFDRELRFEKTNKQNWTVNHCFY